MAEKQYPGWKLGEKKAIREKEPVFEASLAKIKSVLGPNWTLDVDWVSFGKWTDGNSYPTRSWSLRVRGADTTVG
jgi:hypothetical protein